MNLFGALRAVGEGKQVYRRVASGTGLAMALFGDRLVFGVTAFYTNKALIIDYRLGQGDMEATDWEETKTLEWETVALPIPGVFGPGPGTF